MDDELSKLDATAQAALVRSGEVTPLELVDAAIARIEQDDGELNSVIHQRFDKAREEAAALASAADLPFRGVPFAIKDLYAPTAGDPQHNGMRALRDAGYVAPEDSWLTARYKAAGLVIVGRTNTPELGLVPTTEPEAHGATRNPWDTTRSPGGSSGGSAAAVAAGLVPAAHASDGGGSIRIPASMCGLVGLKVTRGRMSLGPDRDESGLSVQHVVTRSVRDCAALLDISHGPGPGDSAYAPPPARPYVDEVGAPVERLRVGLLDHDPSRGAVHPACQAAARRGAALLESLGHEVEEAWPPILDTSADLGMQFAARWFVNARLGITGAEQLVGRPLGEDDVEPATWMMAQAASTVQGVDLALALAAGVRLTRELGRWWASGWDLLVTPTLGGPPPKLGELTGTRDEPFAGAVKTATLVPFTTHFNVSGQPAISLPLWWDDDGLPIGVQLVAAFGREDLLLRVAAQLESAESWADRWPNEH